ncbi:MAG TPA: DDE-type integrase/transposase/recombinase, partial [Sedimentisphaerales bacterium]|nr:DDE-type integrase/transposase/recombinase [Sedimentisphaerales bacterium]
LEEHKRDIMDKNPDITNFAVSLIIKAVVIAARFSGIVRKRSLKRLAALEVDAKDKEIMFLRDMVEQLQMQVSILQKGIKKKQKNTRYTLREKLFILWQMETYQIPRRRITEYFGIARSTLYRWLHKIEDRQQTRIPANKTPMEIAVLIWQITKSNIDWGRIRIANQLALLNIFISASTVRNILQRSKPRNTPTSFEIPREAQEKTESRSIPAWYPNHVWSVDTTMVLCWGLWPIHILVVIDHFSRKVMSVTPLEGPNAGWINNALESAIEKHGSPKHIISDQASVFTGDVFAELLDSWNIKPRLGAVGKHGSISVTERVIKTLKYEWLKRVPIIKGFDHLTKLCEEYKNWYNRWRPHMTLDGLRPDDVYYKKKPEKPKRNAKTVPCNIEHHRFQETRITGYRLKKAA